MGITYRLSYLFSVVLQDSINFSCLRRLVEYLLYASSTAIPTTNKLTFLRNAIFSSVLSAVHNLRTVPRVL